MVFGHSIVIVYFVRSPNMNFGSNSVFKEQNMVSQIRVFGSEIEM